ncbi:hypothetical protein DMB38_00010 [Streptomyces sp. WAC 06738]|uniref:hypothetical protein n=1 Tax=Streptomyces sp. WAC 06738 TaxID=2203210 RepID=UPI000F70F7D3|nr:hypothetical protein [Streptomyces sp. WAC 06738]AZM44420.1 hypothetical protein DMB38_00010 [Streptomyces sp. WAC 06738]
MTMIQLLTLLLAQSIALNLGCLSGIIAGLAGSSTGQAILIGGGTVGGAMTLFLTAVGVYG